MIKRLIKIIYIKITKPAPRLRRSGTGTEPHTYARVMKETSPEVSALAPVTMNPDVLRTLYERGLIRPVTMNPDVLRTLYERGLIREADFIRDREARMEAARTDASRCPCGGHHYPSADACRWCRCHRIQSEDVDLASDVAVWRRNRDSVTESAVRPSDEIKLCGVCGHPRHPSNGAGCPRLVPSGEPSGGIEGCRCDGTRIREYSITDEAVDAAWDSFLGINPDGVEGGPS